MNHNMDDIKQNASFKEFLKKDDELHECEKHREEMLLCILELFCSTPFIDGVKTIEKYFGKEDAKKFLELIGTKL